MKNVFIRRVVGNFVNYYFFTEVDDLLTLVLDLGVFLKMVDRRL